MAGVKDAIIRRLAASHIAGPRIADALAVCRDAARRGWSSTICPWTSEATSPDGALALYLEAIEAIAAEGLDCRLSVKAPALADDPRRLGRLIDAARGPGVALHIDAHGPETAATALALAYEARAAYPNVGCTLPSRWKRSLADAARVKELGMSVRLVKGQWSDPGGAGDHRERFVAIARALGGSLGTVLVATHDAPLARRSLEALREAGTASELELLFSLPLGAPARVARELGAKVRLYAPYGHAYLPYNLAHVRTRPGIALWAMKNFLLGPSRPGTHH